MSVHCFAPIFFEDSLPSSTFFARYLSCDLFGGLTLLVIRVTPLHILGRSYDLLLVEVIWPMTSKDGFLR